MPKASWAIHMSAFIASSAPESDHPSTVLQGDILLDQYSIETRILTGCQDSEHGLDAWSPISPITSPSHTAHPTPAPSHKMSLRPPNCDSSQPSIHTPLLRSTYHANLRI